MSSSIKLLLVDDHPAYRRGISDILKKYYTYDITEAANGSEALELSNKFDFDVILLDESMPVMNGFEAAKRIIKKKPETKIICLTQYDELPLILNYFKLGIKGYITKLSDPEEIHAAITKVSKGLYYIQSRFEEVINAQISEGLMKSVPTIQFTTLEIKIILQVSKGLTSQAIADHLDINVRTVETYRYQMLRKTGLKNMYELLTFAFRNGII